MAGVDIQYTLPIRTAKRDSNILKFLRNVFHFRKRLALWLIFLFHGFKVLPIKRFDHDLIFAQSSVRPNPGTYIDPMVRRDRKSRFLYKREKSIGNESQGGRLMPDQVQIKIARVSAVVTFNPNPQPAAARDQIFWTNKDNIAHWPGLLNADGTINTTFFMPNQIAGNGDTSPIFTPSTPITYQYVCSLHPNEKGTIVVS